MGFLPTVFNPYVASALRGEVNVIDGYFTMQSIEHMKEIAQSV
jgi:hypothetical protein